MASPKTPIPFGENPRRALITGLTGQDGSYLAELLLEKSYEVWGLIRRSSTLNTTRIDHLLEAQRQGPERLHLVFGDLSDAASLRRVLLEVRPHEVYNLGAQSHVQISFQIPDYTSDVTALGCLRLLEAIRDLGLDARFYQASSSEMFGKAVETPQKETTRFYPRSPYAAAKAFAFDVTRNYREAYGIFAVNGILFNHESPRRGDSFVTRKITRAVAAIAAGHKDRLQLGNLDASRDWGFAGDYVDAMWRMLQAEKPDDYVVATGETHTVREFCQHAFEHAGMPIRFEGKGLEEKGIAEDGRLLVEVDPRHFRPADVDYLLGDATRAREELGWKPRVTFAELVRLMVDADIEALVRSGGRVSEVEA